MEALYIIYIIYIYYIILYYIILYMYCTTLLYIVVLVLKISTNGKKYGWTLCQINLRLFNNTNCYFMFDPFLVVIFQLCKSLSKLISSNYYDQRYTDKRLSTFMGLTSTDSSKSLSLNWLSYHLLQPYSIKVTVGVTEQW